MTKFEALLASLRERISSGEWEADERIPSRQDLANEYRVSPTTVSNAIRQIEKEGLVYILSSKGVFVASEELSRLAKQYTIGVRSDSWKKGPALAGRSPLFDALWRASDESGNHVLLMASDRPVEVRRANGHNSPDALIFIGGGTHADALRLQSSGYPVIICNQPVGPTPLSYVDFDNLDALCSMTRRFLSLGHRRIAVLSGYSSVEGYYRRMKAQFLEVLSEAGVLADFCEDYWRTYGHDSAHHDPFHPARAEVEALFDLPKPPTAIFVWVPRVAEYVLEEAERRGFSIPGDLSLAGVRVTEVHKVALSGFTMPYDKLGALLFKEIIATIENPFHHAQHLLKLSYHEGQTVGPLAVKAE